MCNICLWMLWVFERYRNDAMIFLLSFYFLFAFKICFKILLLKLLLKFVFLCIHLVLTATGFFRVYVYHILLTHAQ